MHGPLLVHLDSRWADSLQGDASSQKADLGVTIQLREDPWHCHMVQTCVYRPSLSLHSTVSAVSIVEP